jgi:hypothetical protein
MSDNQSMSDERDPVSELPEAFSKFLDGGPSTLEQQPPPDTADRTSTGMDKVLEGSAESFPGSDPPSTMASGAALPKQPVEPTED